MKAEKTVLQKESNFVSAVVYLHNCESTVGACLSNIYAQLQANFRKFEIICVDDACTDSTDKRVHQVAEQMEETVLSIIHVNVYQGVEASMLAGVAAAIGDYVFEFDYTEMDYEPGLLMEAYRRVTNGSDVVNIEPEGGSRRESRLFYQVFNRFSNTPYLLHTERFRVISRRVINRIADQNSAIIYRKVAYAASGLKNETITYYSVKNISMPTPDKRARRARRDTAMDSIILFTDFAYRFSLLFSIIMALLTLAAAVYTLVIFLTGQPVAGWTTTMLLLSAGFFGIFVILTLLIKYVSVMVRLQMQRKEYSFASVEKVTRS